jgi:hypothetical protein
MPRDTRSRRRGHRSSPRPSRRPTRGRQNSQCITDTVPWPPPQDVPSLPREPNHTMAIFSPITSPPRPTQDQHEVLTGSIRPQHASAPPEVPEQHVKDPRDRASPAVTLREILKPSNNTQEVLHREIEKGNISVIHYKPGNYRPSAPGSKSRPIKVEDSPQPCSPSLAQAEKLSISKKRSKAYPTTTVSVL